MYVETVLHSYLHLFPFFHIFPLRVCVRSLKKKAGLCVCFTLIIFFSFIFILDVFILCSKYIYIYSICIYYVQIPICKHFVSFIKYLILRNIFIFIFEFYVFYAFLMEFYSHKIFIEFSLFFIFNCNFICVFFSFFKKFNVLFCSF